jgi:hypothetical protein
MKFKYANTYSIQCMGQGISLKSERHYLTFYCTHNQLCVPQYNCQCLEYLGYITLAIFFFFFFLLLLFFSVQFFFLSFLLSGFSIFFFLLTFLLFPVFCFLFAYFHFILSIYQFTVLIFPFPVFCFHYYLLFLFPDFIICPYKKIFGLPLLKTRRKHAQQIGNDTCENKSYKRGKWKTKSEIRNQKSEIRYQKSDIRNQKSEIRNQKTENRNQKSEIRYQKSEILTSSIENSMWRKQFSCTTNILPSSLHL